MPVTLRVKAANDEIRLARGAVAHRVLERFPPPENRLLCFLDDADWERFKQKHGRENRGFSTRVKSDDDHWQIAPDYLIATIVLNGRIIVDDLIYVHGTTCAHPVGLTMTLAHELQHLKQRKETPMISAASGLVPNLTQKAIQQLGLRWCDVPHERDARIMAKRTAEGLFGPALVKTYIEDRIAEQMTPADAADWTCVRDLDTTMPFDLTAATKALFPRLTQYRDQLQAAQHALQQHDPEYRDIDIDTLLRGEPSS